ncbi:hypothetical protein KGZ78_00220 [Pseudomonas aeruginosa]|nr:hypothetical protein KGZ78_00220 [Pseudomonas aeruginosa]
MKALKGMIKKPEVSVSIYDMNAAIADVIDLGVDRLADDKEAAADDAPPRSIGRLSRDYVASRLAADHHRRPLPLKNTAFC